jgi:hypothetical protein
MQSFVGRPMFMIGLLAEFFRPFFQPLIDYYREAEGYI